MTTKLEKEIQKTTKKLRDLKAKQKKERDEKFIKIAQKVWQYLEDDYGKFDDLELKDSLAIIDVVFAAKNEQKTTEKMEDFNGQEVPKNPSEFL